MSNEKSHYEFSIIFVHFDIENLYLLIWSSLGYFVDFSIILRRCSAPFFNGSSLALTSSNLEDRVENLFLIEF
jgi:hypothetical protein